MNTLTEVDGAAQTRISTVGMSREEWLAVRKTGIGSSDAATVARLNPYQTPIALWEQKTGRVEPDDLSDNEKVHFGNVLEDVIAQEFARRTGRKVRRVNAILRHAEHPWMLANLDRELVAEDDTPEILECKTVGYMAAQNGEWGDAGDEVPERYLVQVQHQLAVRGRKRAFLAALIGGQEFRIYEIERDDALIENLIKLEAAFWRSVVDGEMPTVTQLADAQRLYPVSRAVEVEANLDIMAAVGELQRAQADRKDAETREEAAKGLIAGFLGEADALTRHGERVLTWKTQSRKGLDSKALTLAHPELAAQYERATSFRVMRIAKGGAA